MNYINFDVIYAKKLQDWPLGHSVQKKKKRCNGHKWEKTIFFSFFLNPKFAIFEEILCKYEQVFLL